MCHAFTAFHPNFKMLNRPRTPRKTLDRARQIALSKGLHYVYTGNVHDPEGSSTWFPGCGQLMIERDWYELGEWNLIDGRCEFCGTSIPRTVRAPAGKLGHNSPRGPSLKLRERPVLASPLSVTDCLKCQDPRALFLR